MMDILSKTDKTILQEIVTQGMLKNVTLDQTIGLVRNFVIEEAQKQVEQMILQGKAGQLLRQFQSNQPSEYAALKEMIEEHEQSQTKTTQD